MEGQIAALDRQIEQCKADQETLELAHNKAYRAMMDKRLEYYSLVGKKAKLLAKEKGDEHVLPSL